MGRRSFVILVLVVFVLGLGGCATARKQSDIQMQGLKNQISVLEAQLRSRDEEINSLREALSKTTQESMTQAGTKAIKEVKSRPKVRQIQTALKNAGYNPGPIDGRMGKQTRDAIKAFQKANNLLVDGKVGKYTWVLLKEYLDKKIK
jgi:peptidoglycan hydrolase-like protein with peptidoglycan-binding domain